MNKFIVFVILLLFVFTIGELNNTTQAQQTLDNTKEQMYKGLELVSIIPIILFMFIILGIIGRVSDGTEIDFKMMFGAIVGVAIFAVIIGIVLLAITSI